jgi:hypothetical protein
LYLSYQHHVKEQYYQLATCEPSEELAELGKRQKLFSGLQHIFLDTSIRSHVIIKIILSVEAVFVCCFTILKSVPGIVEVILNYKTCEMAKKWKKTVLIIKQKL